MSSAVVILLVAHVMHVEDTVHCCAEELFGRKSEMRADAESSSNGDVYLYINVSSCMYLEVEYITEHQNGV